ncbi:DUF4132 domain-containing protein [Tenacibaculum aiptasiae]|uniref:DUF4132 domain-containing protein n=1 Tax=Tenacibaculum aiptasiae TaxID=426481 RepID=UPI003B5B8680
MFNFLKSKLTKKEKNINHVSKIVKDIKKTNNYIYGPNDLSGIEAYELLKKEKPSFIKPFILELLLYIEEVLLEYSKFYKKIGHSPYNHDIFNTKTVALHLLSALMRRNQSYNEEEWITFFNSLLNLLTKIDYNITHTTLSDFPINYAIQQIERHLKKNDLSDELRNFIINLLDSEYFNDTNKRYWGSDISKARTKLYSLIQSENEVVSFSLKSNDIGPSINEITKNTKTKNSKELHSLLILLNSVTGGKPTIKLKKQISLSIDNIGKDIYRKMVHQILQTTIDFPISVKTQKYNHGNSEYEYSHYEYLCEPSKNFIKGIVWSMQFFSDRETISLVSNLLEKSYTRMPGVGPAAAGIGNACAYTLGNIRGKDGLGALARVKLKLKQNNIKKTIDKYLVEGAKKYKVSVEELKEMAVPDFNLKLGTKTIPFDSYKLIITIEGSKVIQQWKKADGSTMKSVPSIVKNSKTLTDKLKLIRKEIKEIQKVYSAQKQRIDNQFILNRTWNFSSFNKYYLNHGIVFPIASKLIWTFINQNGTKENGILRNDNWENSTGEIISWIDETCKVQLWHPIFSTEDEIIAWREKMIQIECKQPIKQAFRELYILTEAEINTQNYSNRMAAHILKQHQFKTLAVMRDWKYSLMGAYDDGRDDEVCSKFLPEYQITAEFWIDELHDYDAFNDTGIWLYITTDQVKFKDLNGEVINLIDVPKVVFTEIMRDVDLFVGVCSVGNDPEWRDNNGDRQSNRDYWASYSFGDLNEIAKTRKTILERLLPRLTKIKNKAHINGKFLIVKGDLRTYKIHIGSGNILMEPNDQYLCIVPARSRDKTTDKLFIPFEGDRGLSIVLSKAFLLAEDAKITDSTITSQINR